MKLFVNDPRRLTAAWAQRVLSAHAEGVEVQSCTQVKLDVGTTSRVWLEVEHDGAAELPRRWFVKLPSRSWKARAITTLPQLPQTEVRFYREVSSGVSVRHPLALAAENRRGRGFMLVLADVTEAGERPGTPKDALNPEQASDMVELLAELHASHWADPRLDAELAWLAGPVRRLEDGLGTAMASPLMKRGLARAGEAVPESLHAPAKAYARARRSKQAFLAQGPRTLIHHDCHPGNLYWRSVEGREAPGLLDWQLVRIGEGVGDVAYLLATALLPEVRREHEADLLERYRGALVRRGVEPAQLEGLFDRYRAHLTYALEAMVVTLAVGGLMDDEVARELCRRAASAVAHVDAFGAFD